ncbi:TPA: membrane integrity-associated transporter subunit PqiC [Legionella pneumophila]|uniref:ABC transporter auxiliary component n=1 Tax=Legionella pneumophila TaxID=446 RepID=A0A378K7P8_LEGPN|nr:ABC-type transport auxiliary lipoprotein family protein [Legionella pneumophila]MCZ4688928.1 ABC-type transport auxiliary lipoprotein family protein [Legionella pneumophila]MCZ4706325.1 ABC-type transport auxiliary lipoprotein family protein [Legionella pneumophila]MCZ4716372.1 ABC-type transport auxiliary lipoprotein family protein [Legionella pneumophila]MCZ4758161.1 ABC-type transport auxiliary lipoprotein family protein [Legionella pneumophila]MCZ4761532.1 ABC-type transport auxiliary l
MRVLSSVCFILGILTLMSCSPVKVPVTNEYQLTAYSTKQLTRKPRPITIQVTVPEAVAGYQTEEMLYMKKPFKLEPFVKNAWTSPPADMLFPLLVQSLQSSGYFYAVTSSPYSEEADYRLDTQLLKLEQNFIKKPSVLELSAKIVLTHISDNQIIGSRIVSLQIPCSQDTPYGGVIAANQATFRFTATATDFVVSHIKRD